VSSPSQRQPLNDKPLHFEFVGSPQLQLSADDALGAKRPDFYIATSEDARSPPTTWYREIRRYNEPMAVRVAGEG
jgi:hypothetical protein